MTDEQLSAGMSALADGRWEEARVALAAAADARASGTTLAGLADAHWWLGDAPAAIELRERAYATFRAEADMFSAVSTAARLCVDYKADLGNEAAAAGWITRAERLLDGSEATAPPSLVGLVWAVRSYQTQDLERAVALGRRALALARDLGDADLELTALGQLGRALVEAGRVDEGMPLLDEAMAGALGGECRDVSVVVYSSCAMLAACDHAADLTRASQWCRAADDFARAYGCPFLYAECRLLYGGVLLSTGNWAKAELELRTAVRAAGEYRALRSRALARLAELRIGQGRLEDADVLVREAAEPLVAALPAAAVSLARGDASTAAALCRRRIEHDGERHIDTPVAFGLLVDALLAGGDVDDASTVANRMVDVAAGADPGARRRMAGQAAMAAGRVCQARGDTRRAAGCFEEAIDRLAELDLPVEVARARLQLARVLAGDQPGVAVGEADAALDAFARVGARADADACGALLRRLGAPGRSAPHAAGRLTRREREVLDLVGAGLSNPEIAERLFISRKTASHHVSNVLTKLGARNRTAAALHASRVDAGSGRPTWSPDD